MSFMKVAIEDLCETVISGGTPLRSRLEYYEGGTIPWVKTKEVNFNRIYDSTEKITEKGLDNSSAKLIPYNSILIAMYGDGNTAGRCAINRLPVTTNQACCNLIINKEKADPDFMFYKISTLYETFVGLKVGGSQQNLNSKTIKEFKINIPNLTTQRKIASILSAYDDLIENNLKRIKLLESFVRINFYRIKMKTNNKWVRGRFSDFFTINNGYAFKANLYSKEGIPVIRTRDYSESIFLNIEKHIFIENFLEMYNKYLLKEFDFLLIMVGASIGKYGIVLQKDIPALQNQNQWALREKNEYRYLKIIKLLLIKDVLDILLQQRTGAARDFFRSSFLNELEISIPPEKLWKKENNLFENSFKQISNLLYQNIKLREAKDILMPKLMSGEIEV